MGNSARASRTEYGRKTGAGESGKVGGQADSRPRACTCEPEVEFVLLVDEALGREVFMDEGAATSAEFFPEGVVAVESQQAVGNAFDFPGTNEEARFIFETDFIRAVEVVS